MVLLSFLRKQQRDINFRSAWVYETHLDERNGCVVLVVVNFGKGNKEGLSHEKPYRCVEISYAHLEGDSLDPEREDDHFGNHTFNEGDAVVVYDVNDQTIHLKHVV